MNTIAPAIKRRRIQLGLTQKDMSDKMHLSEKAWRNIENGVTRLDMERLQEIADTLEMSLLDLINSQESMYVHQEQPKVGVATKEVIFQDAVGESERELFKQVITDKDEQIRLLREELAGVKMQLNGLIEKVMKD